MPHASSHIECALGQGAHTHKRCPRASAEHTHKSMHQLMRSMKNPASITTQPGLPATSVQLVADLFHQILKHNISALTRIWFARLQWPVVNIASIDHEAFANPSHPAQRLINQLGLFALGKGDFELPSATFEKEIERLVLLIERFPMPDVQVFDLANIQFEKFLNTFRAEKLAQEHHAHLKKQLAIATKQYQTLYATHLDKAPAQPAVQDFLAQVWPTIVASHAVRYGLEHTNTQKLTQIGLDLIRLSIALYRKRERKEAMVQVPQLVSKLRQGMSFMGIPAEQQDQHIQNIGSNLSDAISQKQKTTPSESANTERRHAPRDKLLKWASKFKFAATPKDGHLANFDNNKSSWVVWHEANSDKAIPKTDPKLASLGTPPPPPSTLPGSPDFWQVYPGDNL